MEQWWPYAQAGTTISVNFYPLNFSQQIRNVPGPVGRFRRGDAHHYVPALLSLVEVDQAPEPPPVLFAGRQWRARRRAASRVRRPLRSRPGARA